MWGGASVRPPTAPGNQNDRSQNALVGLKAQGAGGDRCLEQAREVVPAHDGSEGKEAPRHSDLSCPQPKADCVPCPHGLLPLHSSPAKDMAIFPFFGQ